MEYLVDEVVHIDLHNQLQDTFVDLRNRAHLGVKIEAGSVSPIPFFVLTC